MKWDEQAFNFSREDCFKALLDGDPSIVPLRTPMGVTIVLWMMAPGQEKLVAQGLREVLERARKSAHSRPPRTQVELARGFGMDNPIDEWNPDDDGLRRSL